VGQQASTSKALQWMWSTSSAICYISQNGNCEKDVKVHIGKASAIFGKMKKVWRIKHINLLTKLRLYEALILSTLLCGAEVWPLTVTLNKKLEAAHHRWLRGILGIIWRDKVTNEEVRKRTGQIRLEKVIRKIRMRWLAWSCRKNG